MISKYNHNSLTWVDLEYPKPEEIAYIIDEYSIPSPLEEEITSITTLRAKIKASAGFVFVSFIFPNISHSDNKVFDNKISFIIDEDIVITIHDKPVQALTEFLNNLEMDVAVLDELHINNNSLLVFYLMKSLYVSLKDQLIINNKEIKELENEIIGTKSKNISKLIYNKNCVLIKIDKCLNSNERILKHLSSYLTQVFGDNFEYYISLIINEHSETKDMIGEQAKSFGNLYNISNLMLIDHNNRKLKILTRLLIVVLLIIILMFLYVFSNI